jgi:hypothetical protein
VLPPSLVPDVPPEPSELPEVLELSELPELPPSRPLVDNVVPDEESLVVTVSPLPPLAEVTCPPSLPDVEPLDPESPEELPSPPDPLPLESRPLVCDPEPPCSLLRRRSSRRPGEPGPR